MHDAFKELKEELDAAIAAGEAPDAAMDRLIPRMFYLGHHVIHAYEHPDRRARWECKSCQYQWISEDGTRCSECGDCKHVWEWVAEPYGDRICSACNLPFKDSFKTTAAYEEYMARERRGREETKKREQQ